MARARAGGTVEGRCERVATHTLSDGTVVKIVHTLKDGTVVDDISKVTVPKEIGQKIVAVLLRYEAKNAKENEAVVMNK